MTSGLHTHARAPVFSMASAAWREAARSGAAPVLAAAAAVVLLSPKLVLFSLGSAREARLEAVVGVLIGLAALVSTLGGILLVRVLVEEGTLDLMVAMGASRVTAGFSVAVSLLFLGWWQALVLGLAGAAAAAVSWKVSAAAAALGLAGLVLVQAGGMGAVGRSAAARAVWTFAWMSWAGLSWAGISLGWPGGAAELVSALGVTAGWGMVIGAAAGARLSVPTALAAGAAVWTAWTWTAPVLERWTGALVSPLSGWGMVLAGLRGESAGVAMPAGLAVCSGAAAAFSVPLLLDFLKGENA